MGILNVHKEAGRKSVSQMQRDGRTLYGDDAERFLSLVHATPNAPTPRMRKAIDNFKRLTGSRIIS